MDDEELTVDGEALEVRDAGASYQVSAGRVPLVPPGYKQTEVGVIPEDWNISTVGSEFEIKLGKMLDAEKNVGVPKPYLGNKAVQWGRIEINNLPTVPMSRTDVERFRLRKGDLLVCEGGEIGRTAIWDAPVEECYYQKALHRLRPLRGFEPRLMAAFLQQWSDQGTLVNYVTQTSIAHLPREKLLEIPMPVPSPLEQRAIATALSDVDALIGALDRLIAKKRDLKQAAMQQLLTGQTRLPGFSGEWEVKAFGEIFDYLSTATNSRSDLSGSGDTFYIHYGDIHTKFHGHLDFFRLQPPMIFRQSCGNAALLKNGDWVMADASEDYDGVGKAIEVSGIKDGVQVVAGLHTFLLREKIPTFAPGFKGHLGDLKSLHQQYLRVATGMKVFGVSKAALKDLILPIPTPEEQTAIATLLSDMDTEIATLETRRNKTRTLKQGMMQELLTGRIRLV